MTLDLSHLLDVFVAESAEYLDALAVALDALGDAAERGELDRAALDEVFRVAHSLKGMCGMMGFDRMAMLTHAMEESLQDARERGRPIERQRLELLLACVDGLQGALEEVARNQQEPETLDRLAQRIGAAPAPPTGEAVQPGQQGDGDAPRLRIVEPPPQPPVTDAALVRVLLADDTELRSVRAFVVLQALGRVAEVVQQQPSDPVGFEGTLVEAWVRGAPPDRLLDVLAPIPELAAVDVAPPAPPAREGGGAPAPLRPARIEPTVRVSAARLDELMYEMQEVVVSTARLEQAVLDTGVVELRRHMEDLLQHARALQSSVMQVRMTTLDAAFSRLPRLVRDLSQRLGKRVRLVVEGAGTEVDRSVVDSLADPLVHLIRNAMDHGVEPPAEREAAGKAAEAELRVAARHAAGQVVITVRDDGRGIDAERVIARAVERGVLRPEDAELAAASSEAALELLFRPGVTGAEEATDISGRGVGMDAVRATIRELGGDVDVRSELGAGTTIELRLPLTLAIMPVLLVQAAGREAAIPLDRIGRISSLDHSQVRAVGRDRVLAAGGGTLPLIQLARALGDADAHDDQSLGGYAVLVHAAAGDVAFEVDRLVGRRELATRALPDVICETGPALLGAGMLPDGDIALIVDCDDIARRTLLERVDREPA